MKYYIKVIALFIAMTFFILTLGPATEAKAQNVEKLREESLKICENGLVTIIDSAHIRIAVYFENGIKNQVAVYSKDTGEILCYKNKEATGA